MAGEARAEGRRGGITETRKRGSMEEVAEKVAFVTGGGSGIGLGIAAAFAGAGMRVALADIRRDHLDDALALFAERGQADRVHAIELDVADGAAFARAADEAERALGQVHVLVSNAGIGVFGPLQDAGYDDWDWGLGVMVGGAVNGVKTFLPRMLAHGEGGHIVITSSMSGLLPMSGAAIYVTAKAALIGLAEAMRGELAPEGIGVSSFCPGVVQSNIRETGRTRPERYRRDSGYLELERKLEERPDSPLWMDPFECGERVLAGVRRNDLYILTHPEFRPGLEERFQAVLASFPDEPLNTARADTVPFLLSNPIFREALEGG
jgi:NAD(P)-dependent dehydrogenase (short-subunit alcohol dehydrogenase family)